MTASQPRVAAVVPVFNRLETTRSFVQSFRSQNYKNKVLVICDDGSTDGTAEFLKEQADVVTVTGDGTLWWSGGTNAAIRKALELSPDYVLTVNDDSLLASDYLERLVAAALHFPGSIMASSLVQLQDPGRHWSLGASYLNFRNVLYVNDCFGARTSHISEVLAPTFFIDTTPGNGVLYPADCFSKAGYFDETWTPQYHGDTLMIHRAASTGIVARLCQDAVIMNDMAHHLSEKTFDPLLSRRSAFYAPAVYKSVQEREGETAALECLWGLAASTGTGFFSDGPKAWRKAPRTELPGSQFEFDPHFAQVAAAGAFAFLGYEKSPGVYLDRQSHGFHFAYTLFGRGVLTLVLRVRNDCPVHCFVITDCEPECLDVIADDVRRGSRAFASEWISWFALPMKPGEFVRLPLVLDSKSAMQCTVILAHSKNVAECFMESS
jgi:GT2 family glycosyltransferase